MFRYGSPTDMRIILSARALLVILIVLGAWGTATGCGSGRPESKTRQIGWRPITSFSGRGDEQTESFNIESTQWRIKWETKGAAAPGAGSFHLVVHSAVSGRPIADVVTQQGDGHGVAFVTEDPRLYHLVIDSKGLDWSLKVEEAVVGEAEPPR